MKDKNECLRININFLMYLECVPSLHIMIHLVEGAEMFEAPDLRIIIVLRMGVPPSY